MESHNRYSFCLNSFTQYNYFEIYPYLLWVSQFFPFCYLKWCYIEWIYDSLFSHSPVDRHMNCLKFLVTMNKAALSIHGQIVV